ncbi:MAG TPA: LuxR C-terminal-related transcriptional regulator, partial [Gemmatimonas sp.]|nr:LuxR C-terminal-related transcriptional regulator [Gemmatimonas sp.]
LSNARVALALGISENTARHHTERIIGKLGLRSRAQIAWRAVTTLASPDATTANRPRPGIRQAPPVSRPSHRRTRVGA